MVVISAKEARTKLHQLIDEVAATHRPLLITGRRNKSVLVAEEDWNAIQESLFLMSVPGMSDAIREGINTVSAECDEEPGW